MFPNPEVIGYINDGLSAHAQMGDPGDTSRQLRGLEQLLGLGMLALIVPDFARQRYRIIPKRLVSSALAPLLATHWSVAYLVALVRTWTLAGFWYTALYHLAAGRAGAFAGFVILFGLLCA